MKRKLITIVATAVLVSSMTACGSTSSNNDTVQEIVDNQQDISYDDEVEGDYIPQVISSLDELIDNESAKSSGENIINTEAQQENNYTHQDIEEKFKNFVPIIESDFDNGLHYAYGNGLLLIDGNGDIQGCPWELVKNDIEYILIRNGVTNIDGAFSGCTSLKCVDIPESITKIGYCTFLKCTSLTSVIMPDSITSIDGSAFEDCSNLTSISIPNSVTSIGEYVFMNCTSLTNIIIPEGITSIAGAFNGCTSLTDITIPESVYARSIC